MNKDSYVSISHINVNRCSYPVHQRLEERLEDYHYLSILSHSFIYLYQLLIHLSLSISLYISLYLSFYICFYISISLYICLSIYTKDLLICIWENRFADREIDYATCVDKTGKRYNIELDNIRGFEDDFEK